MKALARVGTTRPAVKLLPLELPGREDTHVLNLVANPHSLARFTLA